MAHHRAIARQGTGDDEKAIAQTTNLNTARISTLSKSLAANLGVNLLPGFHPLSRHIISIRHSNFLFGHGIKKCLEVQVRKNEASARTVIINYKLNVHDIVERNFRSPPLFLM